MSRATNRTSNISVTWNFKNPNISRNELINFIHLFREVPGYSTGLSRHSESLPKGFPPRVSEPPESFPRGFSLRFSVLPKVSRLRHLKSRDSCCISISLRPRGLRQAPYLHFHQSPARKSPERLFPPSQRPPESFPKGFPLRLNVLPKVPRLRHLKSRDSCCLSISLRPRCLHQAPYLHFHLSSDARPKVSRKASLPESAYLRKSPERISSPIQRHSESFPTTLPEISRFPFGTKVIKILDLSPYLPPTRPFAVSSTLSYSPKPVLHQPRHQTESAPLVHQSPCTFYPHLTLSYNNTHQSSSSLPTITKFAFPTVHPALFSFSLEFRTRRAGNCTEFEAVSIYVTLKK